MFRGLALTALLVTSALASQQTTCQRATNNTEFNPHEPPSTDSTDGSWFEGWYLRVSADDGSGASFGVGIGHFPGQAGRLSSPTAACFILVSSGPGAGPGAAGEQVRLYTRNFDLLHIASPAPVPAPPQSTAAGDLQAAAAAAAGGRTEDAYGEGVGVELERATTAAAARRDAQMRGDVEDGQVSFEVLTGSSSGSSGSSSDSSSGGGVEALWRQHARRRLHAAVVAAAGDRQHAVIKPFASDQLDTETADVGDADQSNGGAGGAGTASADDGGDFCAWRVTSEGVAVAAQLQGTRLQLASTPGACAAAEPWRGPGGCQSPEGWVSKIGFLLRLRYDVLTLRTPVSYSLSEAGDDGGSGGGGGGGGGGSGGGGGGGGAAEAKAGEEKQEAAADDVAAVTEVAGLEAEVVAEVAPGLAQRDDVGAAGQNAAGDGDGTGPGAAAGRLRGGWPLQLSGVGRLHMEKNWGQSFPDQWVWAQGHGSAAGRQTSFVMAGGLLPHALSPALPTVRQYVLAYHPPPPAQPFAVDPWDPPLYSSLAVRGCDGVFSLELHTPLHVVHLVAAAEPHSFQALPCPTNAGFKNYSVESFTATVQLRVLERPFPFAPPSIARLLHEDTFAAAAMEFGGAYVCPEAMPQTAGVLSDELVRARAGRARGGGGGGRGKAASGEVEVKGKGGAEGEIVRQDWSPWRALWSSA